MSFLWRAKKGIKKGNNQLSVIPIIIVKSVGKAATLYLFFSLLSPASGPMLSKTLMFVPIIVLLGGGNGGYLAKEKEGLFFED